jgi:general secretion pathway protein G
MDKRKLKIRNRYLRSRRSPVGFTLMEVLLVLVILVVLASMAVNIFWGTQEKAEKDAAATQVGFYKTAIERFRMDTRQFPGSLEDLVTKPNDTVLANRWGGAYMDKIAKDPWDNDYRFAAPGKHNPDSFDVWSLGPDKQDGTEDDIGNWENS